MKIQAVDNVAFVSQRDVEDFALLGKYQGTGNSAVKRHGLVKQSLRVEVILGRNPDGVLIGYQQYIARRGV
jgi:hypothetical protein